MLSVRGRRALLHACDPVCFRPYNTEYRDTTWEDCSLREWLNAEFLLDSFSASERDRMDVTQSHNFGNPVCGTRGCDVTKDRIFLLSIDEARSYYSADVHRGCGEMWWLRTLGLNKSHAASVWKDGRIHDRGWSVDKKNGVRPAVWVRL